MNELYDRAVAIWLVRTGYPHLDVDKISNIRFGEEGGYAYSEYTQADDSACILFDYTTEYGRKGKTRTTDHWHTITFMEVGEFVGEVSEIIQELRNA